ncbi:LOB domain-containing protein 42-like isoform X2 [Mangifera indica]|uniref:LOB domain-containing protein 42-like isoform X2 n=1 Tax=Mangifera indica TaxID=29780 RepID=UPI001CFBBCF6|nr:LOB domain-containing protein 42-like isoform X2 [Mangifera indica]
MSCSGCRILRKGCSENCMLRHCLQWIDGPQAQANATVFVAKFFGRAGLMSFISAVPETQRPGGGGCSIVSVVAIRGGGEDGEYGERSSGAAVDGELARVPDGGGDGSLRRRVASTARRVDVGV